MGSPETRINRVALCVTAASLWILSAGAFADSWFYSSAHGRSFGFGEHHHVFGGIFFAIGLLLLWLAFRRSSDER